MKVLLVSDMYARPERSISATYFHRQVLELTALGVEVRVLCPLPRPPHRLLDRRRETDTLHRYHLDGIFVRRLFYPKLLPFGWAARIGGWLLESRLRTGLRETVEEFDFDLIHAIRLFPIASSLIPIAGSTGRPLLSLGVGSDVHTNPFTSRGIRRLTRLAIERSDRVAAVSKALGNEMLALGQPRRSIATVYNGVDTVTFAPTPERRDELRRNLGLPAGGAGIVMVSRLARSKGVHELLAAFVRLNAQHKEAWLAIVGDGPERAGLVRRVESLGIGSRVILPGAVPHDVVPQWLNASDIFVLPSYNEGLPNVVMEAMACGLPVLATDVGGISEAVTEACTGFLVQPRSADALIAPLEELLANPPLRTRLGRAGRERVERQFGWRRSAECLLSVYEDMVARHQPVYSVDPSDHPQSQDV